MTRIEHASAIPTEAEVFVGMMQKIGDYSTVSVLWCLLHLQADMGSIKASSRQLESRIGIPFKSVRRSLVALERLELVESDERKNMSSRYRVKADALRQSFSSDLVLSQRVGQTDTPQPLALVCQIGPLQTNLKSTDRTPFALIEFVKLIHLLDSDYAQACVLMILLMDGAGASFVEASRRDLAKRLGIPDKTISHKLVALEKAGLIARNREGHGAAQYKVDLEVLSSRLNSPLPTVDVLPGITPLPALQRIFAVQQLHHEMEGTNHD